MLTTISEREACCVRTFRHEILPGTVVFGVGTLAQVRSEVAALGVHRALVLVTPRQKPLAGVVAGLLGDLCAGIHAGAVQHVPVDTVQDALAQVQAMQADGLVAVGGGSPIGLAKAIALHTSLPILAVTTTYSGSEMTTVWGVTENGRKTTGKNPVVKPKTTIYDPELTLPLPASTSVASGLNAMAHCVEALYAENTNPFFSRMAEESIAALGSSLPIIRRDPGNLEARSDALYGAWLAGTVLASVGMALHHKLCHTLGGTCNLPHAETHAVMLPYSTAYNARHAPAAMQSIARALGAAEDDAPGALFDLARSLGIPASLAELGMRVDDLDIVADLVTQNPYYNPRPLDKRAIRRLLDLAYTGERPTSAVGGSQSR